MAKLHLHYKHVDFALFNTISVADINVSGIKKATKKSQNRILNGNMKEFVFWVNLISNLNDNPSVTFIVSARKCYQVKHYQSP